MYGMLLGRHHSKFGRTNVCLTQEVVVWEHRESVTRRGCFVLSWHPSEYSHTGYDNVSGIFHFSQESHRCSIYGIVDHTLEERKCPLMPT